MSPHLQAIALLRVGDWEAAHTIVQAHDDAGACWLHALVHRLEGDLDNARYWYRRAGRAFDPELTVAAELDRAAEVLITGA